MAKIIRFSEIKLGLTKVDKKIKKLFKKS